MSQALSPADETFARLRARFLSILPFIERQARLTYRHVDNFHDRQDAVADAIAHAWALFLRLAEQDTGPSPFACAPNGFTNHTTGTGNASRNNQTVLRNHQHQPREVRS